MENNRMGKTKDLLKKIRDTKGTFHAKMDLIKDRDGMDLTEEDIRKRWQKYTVIVEFNIEKMDFPGGAVDKKPPADAGNMGSIPGLGRFHVLWSN